MVKPPYLESANSEVDEFLLPLQLQLKLPNKLAAAKQKSEDRDTKKQDMRFTTLRREQAHPWQLMAGW